MPDEADSPSPASIFNQHGRLEIYLRADADWGWRTRSKYNGQITGGHEGYRRRADMLKTLGWMFPGVEPVEVEGPTSNTAPTEATDVEVPDSNPLNPEQVVQLIETSESDEARMEIERLAITQSDNRPTELDPDA